MQQNQTRHQKIPRFAWPQMSIFFTSSRPKAMLWPEIRQPGDRVVKPEILHQLDCLQKHLSFSKKQ
jgi:hypothetical protein